MSFDFGAAQILRYKAYIEKAGTVLTNEYFAIGQLLVSDCIVNLKGSLMDAIEDIFVKISAEHINENEDICDCFEDVRTKALRVPTNSEELIEQGKYMIWVKTVHLHELRERIQRMLYNLTKLIEFGNLTSDHMELNAITVNWLNDIAPVLDQNSIMYEQIKYEAEERLQKNIAEVNKDLNELLPKLVVLNDMDDFVHIREYLHKIVKYVSKMRHLNDLTVWIHKEELVLGFNPSMFKLFDDISHHMYPFYHLLKLCLDLQRKIDVWLDGQFEFLDATAAEERLEEIQKELLKIQKNYRNKLRQANMEDQQGLKFDGIV